MSRLPERMSLEQFQQAYRAQAPSADQIVFRCPACKTLQSAQDLIAAGAGPDFEAVRGSLGFSCIGRFTGAGSPRREPDGNPCNWTLGGLLQIHTLIIVTPDGQEHPHFELASREEAAAHRANAISQKGGAA